jgi:hypothetical protein
MITRAVSAVAIDAVGRVLVAAGQQRAVRALLEQADLVGMADGAVDLLDHRRARPFGMIRRRAGVALGAGRVVVHRVVVLGPVDVQRDDLAVAHHGQVVLAVAVQAFLIRDALVVEDPPDLVRLMTLHAGRHLVGLPLPERALDHLLVHLLDAAVALLARGGDVVAMDGRLGVEVVAHVVGGVAVDADRGDGQTPLEQPLAMDALRRSG